MSTRETMRTDILFYNDILSIIRCHWIMYFVQFDDSTWVKLNNIKMSWFYDVPKSALTKDIIEILCYLCKYEFTQNKNKIKILVICVFWLSFCWHFILYQETASQWQAMIWDLVFALLVGDFCWANMTCFPSKIWAHQSHRVSSTLCYRG